MPERPIPHPIAFRAVMIGLGLVQTVNGLWALFAPHSFYEDFPPGRGGWVSALPAYNEHLLRDVGGLWLATALVLIVAAVWLERRVVWLALVSWLLFAVPHAIYHVFNLEPLDTADAVGNVFTLSLTVVLPIGLLFLLGRPAQADPSVGAEPAPAGGDARIAGVEKSSNPIVRYSFRESRRRYGRVPTPVALTAHAPGLLAGYGAFEMATERSHRAPERLKQLAELKAAQLTGCEWCMDFGSALVRAKGISEDEMRDLLDYHASERFSDEEKMVLDYATGMSRTPVDVPDELFERMRARFDEAQLVELTSIIALENYRGRFNWALGIESEDYSQGAYCVAPSPAASAHTA